MTISLRAAAVIALSAFTASAVSQVAEMPSPDSFRPGDRWEWRQFDNRTKLEEGRRSRTVVSEAGTLKFSDGNSSSPISAAFVGGPAKKPWREWPLAIGKKWQHYEADGTTGSTRADVQVTAYEEVVVPAGRFMAFKIEHKGFYANRGVHRRQLDTYWYAPEAFADVKHVRNDGLNNYTRELLSVTRSELAATRPPATPLAAAPSVATSPPVSSNAGSAADKLRELHKLFKEGVLTQAEYEDKKKELLKAL